MRVRWKGLGVLAILAAGAIGIPASAQEAPAEAGSPVLTVDQDRLFADSAWGRRAQADVEAASAALASENRRIEAELTEEERSLTERRAGMEPEAFRAEADAFDGKVDATRAEQDAKARELTQLRDAERQAFFAAAVPVMGQVMQDRGALVILDSRSVFLAVRTIDVTDELIARIDAEIGAGATPDLDAPAPSVPQPPDSQD